MKIQLKEKFAHTAEEGTIQNFFGTPFTCQHKDISTPDKPTQFIAEWFADMDADEAEALVMAQRADEVQPTEAEKQEAVDAVIKKANKKAK